jgi:hypothetical protein
MAHVKSVSRGMLLGVFAALLAILVGVPAGILQGADHRDSPFADEDPPADIADVYAFINPLDTTRLVLAMTVNGFAVPAVRSTYSLSPEVLYQFKIDNTGDAREDLVIQVTVDGFEASGVRDSRCLTAAGGQFIEVVGPAKSKKVGAENHLLTGKKNLEVEGCTNTVLGTSPGIRAWAGLAADPFVVDIGQFNRIVGGTQEVFRDAPGTPLGDLRGRPIRADDTSGVDSFGGFNVSAIVVEVPIALIQGTASRTSSYLANSTTIGIWGTTSRPKNRMLSSRRDPRDAGPYIQVQRMGQQVFKTVFVYQDNRAKDVFNRSVPATDRTAFSQFLPDALTTTDTDGTGNTIAGRAAVLDALGVTALTGGAPLLLDPVAFANTDKDLIRKVLLPDVLRIDLSLLPPADFVVANNGLQNGRRFNDDVIDIVLRLARQLADVKFPDGLLGGIPGSGPLGTRRPLNCAAVATCDRRVFAVLQGTDFIEPDANVEDLSTNGDDLALRADFPFISAPHPLPGAAGTVGFPPQQ